MSDLAYRTAEGYQCPSCTLRAMSSPAGDLADAADGGSGQGAQAVPSCAEALGREMLERGPDAHGVEMVCDPSDDRSHSLSVSVDNNAAEPDELGAFAGADVDDG